MNEPQPSYKLIQAKETETSCPDHKQELLLDLYNITQADKPSDTWRMEVVGVDMIKFTCKKCAAERVYKLLTERTLL